MSEEKLREEYFQELAADNYENLCESLKDYEYLLNERDVLQKENTKLKQQLARYENGLNLIAAIGDCSNKSIYEAESFMSDIANFTLGHPEKMEEFGNWDMKMYTAQLERRFCVKADGFFMRNA